MTARTATVICGLILPNGQPYRGQSVSVRLNTRGFTTDGASEVVSTAYATSTDTGFTVTLVINDDIDPSGTSYTIRPAPGCVWTFQLTAAHAGQTVSLRSVIVADPTNPNVIAAANLSGVTVTNVPTAVGQVLFCTSLSPLTAAWSTPVSSGGGSSPDLTYGGGAYGAGVYSPAA